MFQLLELHCTSDRRGVRGATVLMQCFGIRPYRLSDLISHNARGGADNLLRSAQK